MKSKQRKISETSQEESQGETFETTYQESSNVKLGSSDSDNKTKQKPRKITDNGEKSKAKASDKEITEEKGEKAKESHKKIEKPTEVVKPSIKTTSKTAKETERVHPPTDFNPQSNQNQIINLVPPTPNNPNDLRSKLARPSRIVPEITILNETDVEIEDRAREERKKKPLRRLGTIPRKTGNIQKARRRESSDSD